MMKVYKDNNVSMSGGCLPLLIQFPILIGLYQVIQKPLSYLLNFDFKAEETISKLVDVVNKMAENGGLEHVKNIIELNGAELATNIQKFNQIPFLTWTRYLNEKIGEFGDMVLNFNFMGLDLSAKPSISLSAIFNGNFDNLSTVLLILIPAVAVFTTWLSTHLMQKMSGTNNAQAGETAQSMTKSMNLMMPIMTGIFTFTLPGAMGIYWIASNIMQIVTQYMLNKFLENKEDDFVVKVPEKNRNNRKKRK